MTKSNEGVSSAGIRALSLALISGVSALALQSAAHAAAADPSAGNTVGEIVVTATGTVQSIQTVPITVTFVDPLILR